MQSYDDQITEIFDNYINTNQDCVRLARSDELNRMFHHVESLRINCFSFKLALVLLRRSFYAFAYPRLHLEPRHKRHR
jgi:hypothetical protein